MQLRFSLAFSNVFLIGLVVLLPWTPLAQGAGAWCEFPLVMLMLSRTSAINRNISPANHDLGVEARTFGVQDGIKFTTKPEGEPLAIRDNDGSGGFVDDWYTLAARTTGE